MNVVRIAPGTSIPEHDETGRDQEEVFLTLAGAPTIVLDGERLPLPQWTFARVDPAGRPDGDQRRRGRGGRAHRLRAAHERLRADGLGMSDDVRAMIERYNDAWNRHDVDAICALHADGMVFENHTAGERAEGDGGPRPHRGDLRRTRRTSPSRRAACTPRPSSRCASGRPPSRATGSRSRGRASTSSRSATAASRARTSTPARGARPADYPGSRCSSPSTVPPARANPRSRAPSLTRSASPTSTPGRCTARSRSRACAATGCRTPPRSASPTTATSCSRARTSRA